MTYKHGLGVVAAAGVDASASPPLGGDPENAVRVGAANMAHGLEHAAEHVAEGELAPALRNG